MKFKFNPILWTLALMGVVALGGGLYNIFSPTENEPQMGYIAVTVGSVILLTVIVLKFTLFKK